MSINIFQRNWAFTSSVSTKTQIKTGSFGPCFVATFSSGKYVVMAHIDDNTNIGTIQAIFDNFKKASVELQNVKVTILGGWKEHPVSSKWGLKLVTKIKEAGFTEVDMKEMYSKKTPTPTQINEGLSKSEIDECYHYGVSIDAKDGRVVISNERNGELEKEQSSQTKALIKKHGKKLNSKEFPVTRVNQ